ncbi:hypothetical protein HMI56_004658 [Coelomomyces lativittatus]|nr:hypothetical protein HMI56_004658 [Coelomomyces lativittatus]
MAFHSLSLKNKNDAWVLEQHSMKEELTWLLSSYLPLALSDIAVHLQDALDALSPTSPNMVSSEYNLSVSTDLGEPSSAKGYVSFRGPVLSKLDVTVKFSSLKHPLKLQCVCDWVLPGLLNAHHHTRAALTLLHRMLPPPFTLHSIHQVCTLFFFFFFFFLDLFLMGLTTWTSFIPFFLNTGIQAFCGTRIHVLYASK